jgi:hypothetical protein
MLRRDCRSDKVRRFARVGLRVWRPYKLNVPFLRRRCLVHVPKLVVDQAQLYTIPETPHAPKVVIITDWYSPHPCRLYRLGQYENRVNQASCDRQKAHSLVILPVEVACFCLWQRPNVLLRHGSARTLVCAAHPSFDKHAFRCLIYPYPSLSR